MILRDAFKLVVLTLTLCSIIGCDRGNVPGSSISNVPPALDSSHPGSLKLSPPIVGVVYFGQQGPDNFFNAFRREDVASDFSLLRKNEINSAVLEVPWVDFQTTFNPCCSYDERSFERFEFVVNEAKKAGLDVVLRIGYIGSVEPLAGDSSSRAQALFNDSRARDAFLLYVERVDQLVRRHSNIRLVYLSWQDFQLKSIAPQAIAEFYSFLDSLPPGNPWKKLPRNGQAPILNSDNALMYDVYQNWLLVHKIFQPAARRLAGLKLESKFNRYSDIYSSKQEERKEEVDLAALGSDVTIVPLALLLNKDNSRRSDKSVRVRDIASDEILRSLDTPPILVDRFNFTELISGVENGANLQSSISQALAVDTAICLLHKVKSFGFVYPAMQDFANSPLYNPSFSYGLDGWNVTTSDGMLPSERLVPNTSGDNDLRLLPGDQLTQVSIWREAPQATDCEVPMANLCISASSNTPSSIEVSVGSSPVQFDFLGNGTQKVCNVVVISPRNNGTYFRSRGVDYSFELQVRGLSGDIQLKNIALFDHLVIGGLYDGDKHEIEQLPSLRDLNKKFLDNNISDARCQ